MGTKKTKTYTPVVRQSSIERSIRAGLSQGLFDPGVVHFPDGRVMVRFGVLPDTATPNTPNEWDVG